jgi:hypothetical protein
MAFAPVGSSQGGAEVVLEAELHAGVVAGRAVVVLALAQRSSAPTITFFSGVAANQ